LRLIIPDGPWSALPWLVMLVALEGILTTRWLATTSRPVNRLAYRTTEIIVILLFLRLFTWVFAGGPPGNGQIETYLLQPLTILDFTYLIYVLLLLFAWRQAAVLAGIFTDLRLSEDEIFYYGSTGFERHKLVRPSPKNRKQLMSNYFRQWVIGGIIIGLLATVTTFDLGTFQQSSVDLRTIGRLGLRPEMLGALLVYFIGGLWLASQGRLTLLRARWLAEGIQSEPKMNQIWHRTSLILIIAVAVIAAFLPIGSTLAIARILQFITFLVIIFVNLIFTLLSMLLFFIVSIFLRPGEIEEGETFDLSQIIPEQFALPEAGAPPPTLLFGTLLWGIILMVVIAAVIFFLRGRGIPLTGSYFLHLFSNFWRRFQHWLGGLWQQLGKQVRQLELSFRERLQLAGRPGNSGLSRQGLRFNSLSPAEKIRYYYLSIVYRAEEKGVERAKSETPIEYAADLKEEWPEADSDVEALTEAFLKARYSAQPMSGEDIGPVKETWNRVKSTLRKRKK
jgi:hypothetical protein